MTGRENKEFEFVKLAKRALRLKSFVSRETVIQVFFAFIPVKVSRFDSFRLKVHSDSLELLNFFPSNDFIFQLFAFATNEEKIGEYLEVDNCPFGQVHIIIRTK